MPGNSYFSKLNLEYVYSQIPSDEEIQEHCNFNILGGAATGLYRFLNGFWDKQATQRSRNQTLGPKNSKFLFIY